jgi:riboflavin kinase/FMN adenylyltransferase
MYTRFILKKSVICIGSFNGLHLGHIAVIQAAVEYASKYSFKVILIRIKKEGNLNLQNKIIDKSLLKRHGVNKVIEYDFLDIKNILGRDFLDKVIYENNVQGIFVGEDFKYGKNGDGNISTLHNTCQFYNIYSQVIPLVVYNEQ